MIFLLIGAQFAVIVSLVYAEWRQRVELRESCEREIRAALGTGQSDWLAKRTADRIVKGLWL